MERKKPEAGAEELRDFEVIELEEHQLPRIAGGQLASPICDTNFGCIPD